MSAVSTAASVERVKMLVKMPDVVKRYHHVGQHRWRTTCPIHGGSNDQALYYDEHSFKCFSCGAYGDVIDFVQLLNSCSFRQALHILDTDFNVGLDSIPAETQALAEEAARRKREETASRKQRQELQNRQYRLLLAFRRWLIRQDVGQKAELCVAQTDRLIDGIVQRNVAYDYDMRATIRGMYNIVAAEKKEMEQIVSGENFVRCGLR